MRQFLDMVRENKTLREQVEAGLQEANNHFMLASSVMKKEALDEALLAPSRRLIWR